MEIAIHEDTRIAILNVHLELLLQCAPFRKGDGCHHYEFSALGILLRTLHDILRRVLLHLLSADRRIRTSDAGKEQSQVFVDFRCSTYGRSGIARDNPLFDGDSRRNTLDKVALRLIHTPQKLAGIARQTLHVTALPLGIKRIKCQRRLAAATHTCHYNQFVAWNLHIHVLQVVHPGSFYLDVITHELFLESLACKGTKKK